MTPDRADLITQVSAICHDGAACLGCEYSVCWSEPRGDAGYGEVYESMRGCRLLGDGERMACAGHVERCPAMTEKEGAV